MQKGSRQKTIFLIKSSVAHRLFKYLEVNSTLWTKTFLVNWKTTLVIIIPKPVKDKQLTTNYCFTSLFPELGKFTEEVILNRVKKHFYNEESIPDYQFGFKENHLTT